MKLFVTVTFLIINNFFLNFIIFKCICFFSVSGAAHEPDERNLPDFEEYNELVEAEMHGELNQGCHIRYSKCQQSFFDVLPNIEHIVS